MSENKGFEDFMGTVTPLLKSIYERKQNAATDNVVVLDADLFETMGHVGTDAIKEYVASAKPEAVEKWKEKGLISVTVLPEVSEAQSKDFEALSGVLQPLSFKKAKAGRGTAKSPDKVTNFVNTLKSAKHAGQTAQDVMFDKLKEADPSMELQEGTPFYKGDLISIGSYVPSEGKCHVGYKTNGTWKEYYMNNPGTLAWNVKRALGIVGKDEEEPVEQDPIIDAEAPTAS
jgi:hypothetical protein